MMVQKRRAVLFLLTLMVMFQSRAPLVSFAKEEFEEEDFVQGEYAQEEEFTATVKRHHYRMPDLTVIGDPTWCEVQRKDTLLDIARRNGLGFNEVGLLYPRTDAWVPPAGKRIFVPTLWVLPTTQLQQLIINVAELRLYFFDKKSSTVQTYPIGIGDEGWETPLGTFHITDKRTNPIWYIPASLQAEYGMTQMPPGPENPLGDFVMSFSAGPYGIHGTSKPWGVGRLVSHGCIRCYPEHIRILFPQVRVGTKLEIIYEPVKLGGKDGQVFVEAHPDVYKKIPDYARYALDKLERSPYVNQVDRQRFLVAVGLQNGVPTNVSRLSKEGISSKGVELMR
jgi:L,D-transpeptidase ErfK/SrfK